MFFVGGWGCLVPMLSSFNLTCSNWATMFLSEGGGGDFSSPPPRRFVSTSIATFGSTRDSSPDGSENNSWMVFCTNTAKHTVRQVCMPICNHLSTANIYISSAQWLFDSTRPNVIFQQQAMASLWRRLIAYTHCATTIPFSLNQFFCCRSMFPTTGDRYSTRSCTCVLSRKVHLPCLYIWKRTI